MTNEQNTHSTVIPSNEIGLLIALSELLLKEYSLLLDFNSQLADQQSEDLEHISVQKIHLLQALSPFVENTKQSFSEASNTTRSHSPTQARISDLHETCERQNYINGELLNSYQERIEWSLEALAQADGINHIESIIYNKQGFTSSKNSSGINQYS